MCTNEFKATILVECQLELLSYRTKSKIKEINDDKEEKETIKDLDSFIGCCAVVARAVEGRHDEGSRGTSSNINRFTFGVGDFLISRCTTTTKTTTSSEVEASGGCWVREKGNDKTAEWVRLALSQSISSISSTRWAQRIGKRPPIR